jgi:hypothetical protein
MSEPLNPIDLKRLAAEVSFQHGIRIDPDDPMFAVVTINRLIFDQAVAEVLERMQASIRDFEAATDKVQIRAGVVLAQQVRECGMALRQQCRQTPEEAARPTPESQVARHPNVLPKWNSTPAVILIGSMLFAAGVLVGGAIQ